MVDYRINLISNQITDLQNQLRKYYIDAYLDIQQREAADDYDDGTFEEKKSISRKQEPKKIEQKADDGSVIITSPEDLKERLDAIRKERALQGKAKEAEFEEVEK